MNKFPNWLPTKVYEHAEQLIQKDGLNDLEPLLRRLVASPEMKTVWNRLSSKTDEPQKLIDFLEYVRLHSTLQGNNTDPIAIPSDKEQRKVFKKLSALSQRMIKEMRDLSPSGKPEAGWGLLETALRRAELNEVQQVSNNAFFEIKSLQNRLNGIDQHESIISLLQLIGSVAHYASTAPDAPFPKKRNTENAKRNQLILDLKRYLELHFATESPSVIAAIVNTAFDFADGGVSVDDVRKLKT